MKNLVKLMVVACGFIVATVASSTSSKAAAAPGEGCRGKGDCGTTPAGVKLNGSYTVWN